MEKITYNPKFGFRDFVMSFRISDGICYHPKTLSIFYKAKNGNTDGVYMKMSQDEFERLKHVCGNPITIV